MAVCNVPPIFIVPRRSTPPQKIATRVPPYPVLSKNLALDSETQLRAPIVLPRISPKSTVFEQRAGSSFRQNSIHFDLLSVAFPCIAHSNTLLFSSAYNCQVIVGDNEPEERLIGRFRREVSKAGVIRECKRRRFFETSQERRKRKTREAAQKNRKRRPRPRVEQVEKEESSKAKKENSKPDNWDHIGIELPYS